MLIHTILLALFVLSVLVHIVQRRRPRPHTDKSSANLLQRLPGPRSIPVLGSIPWVFKWYWLWSPNHEILRRMSQRWGSVFQVDVGVHRCVLIGDDIELAKGVMNSDAWCNRYNEHPMFYERSFNQSIGLALANGDGWKEIRRFTTRTLRKFGFGKGNSMEGSIQLELSQVLDIFQERLTKGNGIVDMHLIFNVSVLNIIWSMMAGTRFSRQDKKLERLLQMIDKVSKSAPQGLSLVFALPFLRHIPHLTEHDMILRLHKETQDLFREIVRERREKGQFLDNPSDFIDAFLKEIHERSLLETNSHYTDEQLIMTCTDLFFTGSDTTSTTLEFAFLYMMLNPRVQVKVQEEIAAVIGNDREPCLDDRLRMPYTEATMLEVLRYSSILPLTLRSPLADDQLVGCHVEKGTMTAIDLHNIHFSEKHWEDPKEFRPERFLDSENRIINAGLIMPFGYGKRACMGEALAKGTFFLFFTSLTQKYWFEVDGKRRRPTTDPISGFTQYPQPYHALVTARTR